MWGAMAQPMNAKLSSYVFIVIYARRRWSSLSHHKAAAIEAWNGEVSLWRAGAWLHLTQCCYAIIPSCPEQHSGAPLADGSPQPITDFSVVAVVAAAGSLANAALHTLGLPARQFLRPARPGHALTAQ